MYLNKMLGYILYLQITSATGFLLVLTLRTSTKQYAQVICYLKI